MKANYLDFNRLDEDARCRLLDRLAQQAHRQGAQCAMHERRKFVRIEYRKIDLPMLVEHLGGGVSQLLVCTRNLSAGGLAFLNGGFLHRGTRCCFVLHDLNQRRRVMVGAVTSCRLIERCVHEVGVQLNDEIDPNEFIDAALPVCRPAVEVPRSDPTGSQNALVQLLNGYLQEVANELLLAINPPNLATARALCQQLMDAAGLLKCERISISAAEAIASLDSTTSIAKSAAHLRYLSQLCNRVSRGPT